MNKPLLPTGCYDLLPPFAQAEAQWIASLLETFAAHGYEQVAPPLLEYTESLLAGRGASLAPQTFRVMEVDAGKVMGIRADITLQIARIAATRLASAPRPLRLSYAGTVLRMTPEGPNASRELRQAGIELIGAGTEEADAEIIAVAAESLERLGITAITIDLHAPGILAAVLADEALEEDERKSVIAAVAHKDVSAPCLQSLTHGAALITLMQCCGTAETMLPRLRHLKAPLAQHIATAGRVAALLAARLPAQARVSVDLTESRGFEYHTGLSFSLFAAASAQELGRGGRYRIGAETEATGCTLYLESLRPVLPAPAKRLRVFVSGGISRDALAALHDQGFATLRALPGFASDAEDARAQSCTHYWRDGILTDL